MKNIIGSMVIAISFVFVFSGPALSQDKTILIIESYHSDYPWDKSYIEGIKEGMKGDYEFLTFEMNTKRIPKSEYEKSAQKAWDFYQEKKPSLIFIGDDNALKYLAPKFTNIETPIVFLGINNNPRNYFDTKTTTNMSGVLERPLLKRSIADIKTIVDVKKVLVLFDSGTTSQITFDEIFKGNEQMKIAGIDTHMKLIGSWETWQKTVKESKNAGYDAIVIGLYHTIVDASKTHIDAAKVLSWTAENTPIPPFAFWDFAVGPGKAIGGLTLLGKTQGIAAAEMATAILNGKSPRDVKIMIGKKGQLLFSKSQLEKFNIVLPTQITSKAILID